MRKLKYFLVLCFYVNISYSQIPSEDPNFIRIFNDDFDGTSINRTSNWNVYNHEPWVPRFIDDPSTINTNIIYKLVFNN